MLPNKIFSSFLLGFSAILGLISTVVILNLRTVEHSNERLEQIVYQTTQQSSLLIQMKDAIQSRQVLLRELFLTEDPFEFDDKMQMFSAAARSFIKAKLQLDELELSAADRAGVDKMLQLVSESQPIQEMTIELLANDQLARAAKILQSEGLPRQNAVVHQIGFIVARQNQATKEALEEALLTYQEFRQLLIATGLLLFFAGSGIAIIVARRIHRIESRLINSYQKIKEANQMLSRLAIRDSLTGLANRYFLDQRLKEISQHCSRSQAPLAVIMLDIDFFKSYNDKHGHQYGDDVIKRVADVLRNCMRRDTDIVARYGGEEFVIVMPHTPPGGMLKIAKSLQSQIIDLSIPSVHPDAPLEWLTVSIGCAHMIPSTGTRGDDLIAIADRALYKAKRNDRNGIVVENRVPSKQAPVCNE